MREDRIHRRVGDGIEGERIAFKCRKCTVHPRPVPNTSSHRSKAGKLDNALCVIDKRFRHIPEEK
jgi:hypothetical protein